MNEPHQVLIVTKSTAGVAEYVRRLVRGMNRSDFSFTVACLSEGGEEFAEELSQAPGVKTFSLEMNRYRIDPVSDLKVLVQLARHIRSGHYDLIHAHASKPGFLTRVAVIGTGVPVIYSPHGFSFHQGVSRSKAWFFAFIEYLVAPFTRMIITVSEGERELARKYHIGSDSLFSVIHTGVDPQPYRISVNVPRMKNELGIPVASPVVGAIGRLNKQKSPLDFIRMAETIHRNHPDVHYLWVGSGPLELDSQTLARNLNLESVMHFVGQRDDVPTLIKIMDCLVLPSRWEGFPLVVLDALAADVPVVATDISGTRESIKHGHNGWLVPVGDSEAMARYVLDILDNPEKAALFRENGRKRVKEEFTTQSMLSAIESVYESLC